MADSTSARIETLRAQFARHGQAHVFSHWDRLTAAGRLALLEQAERLAPSLDSIVRGQRRAIESLSGGSPRGLAPPEAIMLPEHGGDPAAFEAAARTGEALLRARRVGVFVVAGGQGSRLGFEGPKGAYPVGPISKRSLFQIQAQKIRGLSRRSGYRVPWYVMTSDTTDAATRALFEREAYFGLAPEDVFIFAQGMIPACDLEGRFILDAEDHIFESPNGHGGALLALKSSGALDHMHDRGIDRIFYYQVDNPLVVIGDPTFLGFHERDSAEMSCKVIRKRDPMEKVGVLALVDGALRIVEYTELADDERHATDAGGGLAFWAGSIAIHVLNTDFVERVAREADSLLPLHASLKRIPSLGQEANETLAGDRPNGYKLERFVFDALPAAERVSILEVRAEEEFSPIKNADGNDSPSTARRDLVALYRRWLQSMAIELDDDVALIEIDHARIDSAAEAAASTFRSLADASDVVQVTTGLDR